jgi:DHA1 family bicyclomycin/chloramphenicol resistance-like MFS transporter
MSNAPSRAEFIALKAMLFATIAGSIDAMLPALPHIAETLSPEAPNRAQLIVASFVLGMGLGTFVTGPLSDAFGRRPLVFAGAGLYIIGSIAATVAPSLEALLVARIVQGLGAAGPRVVSMAIIRDQYAGRHMARIMSFVMMVFTLVPAVAPFIGSILIGFSGWKTVFWAFAVFSITTTLWFWKRQPETLAVENRRPFEMGALIAAVKEVLSHRLVLLSIAVQALAYAILFSTIATIQPIYDITFSKADEFPLWFAFTALIAMSSSYINARLVVRIGMQKMVSYTLGMVITVSSMLLIVLLFGVQGQALFFAFLFWQLAMFFQAGLVMGNLNALAMEPLGHIAGSAASVISAVSTVIGVALSAPIGLMFDGTPLPLATATWIIAIVSLWLMLQMRKVPKTV